MFIPILIPMGSGAGLTLWLIIMVISIALISIICLFLVFFGVDYKIVNWIHQRRIRKIETKKEVIFERSI